MGNYVTLAQIEDKAVARIKEQRLSPLYISVHSTNPATRETLLGKKPRREILGLMQELADSGIKMHSQIVVCPGINDGADLEQSINDLHGLCPSVMSLAVVPVGLTSYRNWDLELRPISKEEARKTILLVEAMQESFLADRGSRFVFIADEYYLKADMEIPAYDAYEDFPQLENGVGMIADFRSEAADVLQDAEAFASTFDCSMVTGLSPLAEITSFTEDVSKKTGISIKTFPVKNCLFGETVTVTGLISGQDIVSQLEGESLGEVLFIPDILLRDGEGSLIDDYTLDMIKDKLGLPVVSFESTPGGFLDALVLWEDNRQA
jgi:putative radical SAM enzyme (TIGR03279 family)